MPLGYGEWAPQVVANDASEFVKPLVLVFEFPPVLNLVSNVL
jgi:hypothetical protein